MFRENARVYATVNTKPTYKKKKEENQGKQTSQDQIYFFRTLLGKHAPRPDIETYKSREFQVH